MDAYTILLFLSICRAELVSRLWWILMLRGLWSGYQSELFYSVETQVSVSESSEYLSVFFGRFRDQFICKGFQSDTL